MWKTAETLYKPHMRLRVFRSHPCLKKHAETPALDVEIFAVLVWQIEEHAIRFAKFPVPILFYRRFRSGERFWNVGKRSGAASVQIA